MAAFLRQPQNLILHAQPSPTTAKVHASPVTISIKVQQEPPKMKTATTPDSTDWITSTLTRRFGLGAGLTWVGFLTIGVVAEQIKTRFEVSRQESNTVNVDEEEVVLPNGLRYNDITIGGGSSPRIGDIVVIDLVGRVEGSLDTFVDTLVGDQVNIKKPLALVLGSRPYSRGVCEGIEYVLTSMKAGGKRRVKVPPELGFGDKGADLGSGVQIPANATLDYIVKVERVSIAPA